MIPELNLVYVIASILVIAVLIAIVLTTDLVTGDSMRTGYTELQEIVVVTKKCQIGFRKDDTAKQIKAFLSQVPDDSKFQFVEDLDGVSIMVFERKEEVPE